ncbi:hypothetical protein Pyn_14456 [Prunus yedoensis var. nudiflora]|uniref:Uncharacterized protein n=1 Tax=Prunus yedoensis var. nudiflora TaxID=2094558 RepID=A0A314XXT8_PRUYE|nr:hypothetical protein Pyn_14456 [Prunus yedoensis var. nudiflora]
MQNFIAAQLGVQRITGIAIFNTREEQTYDPLPDLEDQANHLQALKGIISNGKWPLSVGHPYDSTVGRTELFLYHIPMYCCLNYQD